MPTLSAGHLIEKNYKQLGLSDHSLQKVKEVNNKSDVVILLFNATQQDLTKLYSSDLELDMILSSRGRTRSSDGGAQIPTYIAGDRGKILYKFELNFVDKTLPFTDLA